MPNGFLLVIITLWLMVANVDSLSVFVSNVVRSQPGQIIASNVYSALSPSSRTVSIQAWLYIPSQNFQHKMQLLAIQPSSDSRTMTPDITIVNSSHAAVELSTTESGNLTEVQLFPHPLAFDEWLFFDIVISSGPDRNISTTIRYPDGRIESALHPLKGDMLKPESADLLMTASRPSAHCFLGYFAIADAAPVKFDSVLAPPDQIYSDIFTSGGQIFEHGSAARNISCFRPGYKFSSIEFASFGRPYGVYPNFMINPTCHSNLSMNIARSNCIGMSSCSIKPDIAEFGDPCPGYRKSIAIRARCSPSNADQLEDAGLSPLILSPPLRNDQEHVRLGNNQLELLQGMNISLQIVFNGPLDDYALASAIGTFVGEFCTEFNTTSDRIINPSLGLLRQPLMFLSFTILPPVSLYDNVGARQLSEEFDEQIQRMDCRLRQTTLLAGAPQPPVPISIIDVKIRLCNDKYVYVQKLLDSCSAAAASSQELTSASPTTIAATAAVCGFVIICIGIVVIRRRLKKPKLPPKDTNQKSSVSDNPIAMAVSMPPGSAPEDKSPSNFSIVKSNVGDRPMSQPKLSVRNFPMRIDRLAAIAKQSYQATDSETDSAFLSDVNNLSIESGPARVDVYFTDSS